MLERDAIGNGDSSGSDWAKHDTSDDAVVGGTGRPRASLLGGAVRRARLAGPVTHFEPLVECVRPRRRAPEPGPPVPRYRQQPWIQRLFERFDRLGVRRVEVAVLASPVPVPLHDDATAEARRLRIEGGGALARRHVEQSLEDRPALLVPMPCDRAKHVDSGIVIVPAPSRVQQDPAPNAALTRLIRRFDPAARDARNRALGKAGEA